MITLETTYLPVSTKGFNDIIDITAQLQVFLTESGFREGSVLLFVAGSTAGLTTVEFEDGLVRDLKTYFERWAPISDHYHHNDRWQDGNGYAHVRAALLKPHLQIPFINGQLCLGTWQQIVLIDFDNRPRSRQLVVQFQGLKGK